MVYATLLPYAITTCIWDKCNLILYLDMKHSLLYQIVMTENKQYAEQLYYLEH